MPNRYPTRDEIEAQQEEAERRARVEAQMQQMRQMQLAAHAQRNAAAIGSVIAQEQYPWRQYTDTGVGQSRYGYGNVSVSDGTTVVSADQTIKAMQQQIDSHKQEIAMLRRMLEHPDRPIIQDIEGIIEHGSSNELFRAHPPFDCRAVWAKVKMAGNGLAQTLQVTLRDGTTKSLQVVGFAVREVKVSTVAGDQSNGAYFLPVDINRMSEMEKKQVATDLIASIIEERVIDKMERENDR